jgi:NitT/TauT family transport system substrate-binding protein
VKLVLIDDPVAMRDAYVAGDVHIGWATLDMLPLMMEGLRRDSRTMPRVPMQIDFSNGGDGIVCRESVRSMSDLAGKTLVLAQNSPSHFFALNALVNAGLQPGDVQWRFTQDAFQAAAAFNADRRLDCVVSWAPDIYNLSEARGNKMMVTTETANKLIADVFFVRADFMKDHPDLIEGLVRGILDATGAPPVAGGEAARGAAHGHRLLHARLRRAGDAGRRVLDQLRGQPRLLPQRQQPHQLRAPLEHGVLPVPEDRRGGDPGPLRPGDGPHHPPEAGARAALLQPDQQLPRLLRAHHRGQHPGGGAGDPDGDQAHQLLPQLLEPPARGHPAGREEGAVRPQRRQRVDEIGQLAGQYGTSRIVIEGHTDASMQGQVPLSMVQELSLNRANAVKEAVLRRYPSLDPNQFATAGMAWTRPADAQDAQNAAKNRRVEVKVYPAEAVQ